MNAEEILESISDAFYAVDADWRFTYVNGSAETWWGRTRDELIGKNCWSEFPQAMGTELYQAHLGAAQDRAVRRLEAISPTVGHWLEISIFPNAAGLCVYFRDISERKSAQARQMVLINELNHRVKNTLATVQAIASQTFRGPDVEQPARARFLERLVALARANDLLVAEGWRGARIGDVVAQVAEPHVGADGSSRFTVVGPELLLSPQATNSLALALHELATNAAKYGALTCAEGSVCITWAVEGTGDDARFHLEWVESGGPAVLAPNKTGFGTYLLERAVALNLLADVRILFPPEGLNCAIDSPLAQVAAFHPASGESSN